MNNYSFFRGSSFSDTVRIKPKIRFDNSVVGLSNLVRFLLTDEWFQLIFYCTNRAISQLSKNRTEFDHPTSELPNRVFGRVRTEFTDLITLLSLKYCNCIWSLRILYFVVLETVISKRRSLQLSYSIFLARAKTN